MSLEYRKGDLLKGDTDIIVHGCNCFCNFGSGVAKAIRETFPEAYEADCMTPKGDRDKLGSYTTATSKGKVIVNAYTQYGYGKLGAEMWGKSDLFDYEGFRKILKQLSNHTKDTTFGFPKIGAGLARGDWNKIEAIIKEELKDFKVVIYVL